MPNRTTNLTGGWVTVDSNLLIRQVTTMPHARRRGSVLGSFALGAVVVLGLAACTAGSDRPEPTPRPTSSPSSVPPVTESPTPTGDEPTADPSAGIDGQPFPQATSTVPAVDPDPGDYPASPLVTFAAWNAGESRLEVGGVVSGQLDPDGTCRLVVTRGSTTIQRTSSPQAAASSVDCGQFTVPRSELTSGSWSVVIRYVVGDESVASDPEQVEVP